MVSGDRPGVPGVVAPRGRHAANCRAPGGMPAPVAPVAGCRAPGVARDRAQRGTAPGGRPAAVAVAVAHRAAPSAPPFAANDHRRVANDAVTSNSRGGDSPNGRGPRRSARLPNSSNRSPRGSPGPADKPDTRPVPAAVRRRPGRHNTARKAQPRTRSPASTRRRERLIAKSFPPRPPWLAADSCAPGWKHAVDTSNGCLAKLADGQQQRLQKLSFRQESSQQDARWHAGEPKSLGAAPDRPAPPDPTAVRP